jgi:hypothetical protein
VEKPGHFPTSENPEQFRDDIAPVLQPILQAQTDAGWIVFTRSGHRFASRIAR